jgi:hypothetical protein
MKYALLLSLLLTGCYQSVNSNDIEAATRVCGGIDKVTQINANFAGEEVVICTNRTSFYLTEKTWK